LATYNIENNLDTDKDVNRQLITNQSTGDSPIKKIINHRH